MKWKVAHGRRVHHHLMRLIILGRASFGRIDLGHFCASALYVYNHNPREDEPQWSRKETPDRTDNKFFLNKRGYLCLDRKTHRMHWQVWCLADIESEWIQIPSGYVFSTDQNRLIGTLPAKIISTMANLGQ